MAAPKRQSLIQAASKAARDAASRNAEVAAAPPPEPAAAAPEPAAPAAPEPLRTGRNRDLTDSGATTAIHIPREDLALLRRVAVERANRNGGRPSVSDVLRELIDRHRAELEREASR